MEREDFQDSKGNPYSAGNLRAAYCNRRNEVLGDGLSSERAEDIAPPNKEPEPKPKEVPVPTPFPDLDDRIRAVAREVFQEMLQDMQNERNILTSIDDAPPPPEVLKGRVGRKENRIYKRLTLTLDEALYDRFIEERNRLKVSSGRLADIILWQRYGKPKLSYESSEDSEQ